MSGAVPVYRTGRGSGRLRHVILKSKRRKRREKRDRAWAVDGKPVVLEVLVPEVFEEDKVEALEVEVLEAPVPVVFEEDRVEARVALAEDKAVAREEVPAEVLEVPVALVEDRTDNRENREADMKQALASAVLAGAPAYV